MGTYKEQRNNTIILAVVFVVCVVVLGSCVAGFYAEPPMPAIDRAWIDEIPQIERDFELIREHLDILRNGEFAARGASTSGVWLRYGARSEVHFDSWHTIEWLPPEELDALLFLSFLSQGGELKHSFVEIGSTSAGIHSSGGGGGSAFRGVQILYPGVDPQRLNFDNLWIIRADIEDYTIYTSDLGYGYTIQIFVARNRMGNTGFVGGIVSFIHLGIITLLSIGTITVFVFLLLSFKKLRQAVNARKISSEQTNF